MSNFTKQRSIHMDDETFDILERLAGEYKANNSTIVRMALIQFDRRIPFQEPSPTLRAQLGFVDEVREEVAKVTGVPAQMVDPVKITGTRDIALPDPKVSSFSVSGGKVRQRVPRNEREDDGLDV